MRLPRRRCSPLNPQAVDARRRRREDLVRPLTGIVVALFLVVCILGGGIGYVAIDARKTAERAETNQLALRVSCIVLSNTIIQI